MKVTGSYASVTRGVSQQTPQDRFPGQHHEQINYVSDPVRGLARRHGTRIIGESVLRTTSSDWQATAADTDRHVRLTVLVGGVEYDIMFRSKFSTRGATDFLFAFNKTTKKFLSVQTDNSDLVIRLMRGGVSSGVQVGKYVLLAGRTVVPAMNTIDVWGSTAGRNAVWVRSGAYSRTYSITLRRASGAVHTVTYTTMPASYPGVLDTSDIPAMIPDPADPTKQIPNPNYQKLVNDRTYAYNSAVTKHIGDAAKDITPQNIASKLYSALVALALPDVTYRLLDSTVGIRTPDAEHSEVTAKDGGDGTGMRAVSQVVSNVDQVSTIHYPNKVVRVQPKKTDNSDALYLRAIPQTPTNDSSLMVPVRWVEDAGERFEPQSAFGIVHVTPTTLYLAGSPAGLESINPTGDHPQFQPSIAGDAASAPAPYFFGKRIDYLGMFQDRLVIGCGAVLLFSRTGDYFNWFRSSVLTMADDDPVELYALGSEDDIISSSTNYDRNLVLFGMRQQYVVSGRAPLTPRTASIVGMSAHEDATDANPVNSGNLLFYTKYRNNKVSAHQIQIGLVADSPESFEISRPLDSYITGRPAEILAVTSPNTVLLRTEQHRRSLFVYNYQDTAASQERLFDSWSHWRYHEQSGVLLSASTSDGDLLLYWLRRGHGGDGVEKVYIVVEIQPLDTELSDYPYLDCQRKHGNRAGMWHPIDRTDEYVVVGSKSAHRLMGVPSTGAAELEESFPEVLDDMHVGLDYSADSFVTPTNPYVRDQNDKVITTGRLTLGRVVVSVVDTGGMTAEVSTTNGTKQVLKFEGRIASRVPNYLDQHPIVTTTVTVPVGREARACQYTLRAYRWLPSTFTAIEWVGQYFNNSRRI